MTSYERSQIRNAVTTMVLEVGCICETGITVDIDGIRVHLVKCARQREVLTEVADLCGLGVWIRELREDFQMSPEHVMAGGRIGDEPKGEAS